MQYPTLLSAEQGRFLDLPVRRTGRRTSPVARRCRNRTRLHWKTIRGGDASLIGNVGESGWLSSRNTKLCSSPYGVKCCSCRC